MLNMTPALVVYAVGDPAADLKTAEEALAAANEELGRAQEAYDAFLAEDPDIETKYAEAQKNLADAEAAAEEAALAYESAKAKAEAAEAGVNAKTEAYNTAKAEWDAAETAYNAKSQARDDAYVVLQNAEEEMNRIIENALDDPAAAAARRAYISRSG